MSICVILNPHSGTAAQSAALYGIAKRHPEIVFWETSEEGHALELARDAARAGYDVVAAAGGDGTVHEVVNGMMAAGETRSRFGIIPLGTGNDLARTLLVPLDPADALRLLLDGRAEPLDLIQIDSANESRYIVNAAAGGFSGQVDEVMSEGLKSQWGPLAYLLGAVAVLPDLTGYETSIAYEDGSSESMNAMNVIVANGKTVAGGKRVAPMANPQDGLLDVVVVKMGSVIDLAGVAARLLTGNYLDSPLVLHRQVERVRIDSAPCMWFNVDGELWANEPVAFKVVPAALQVMVGPDFGAALDETAPG